jgi:Na+/H+ antiporter NhaC
MTPVLYMALGVLLLIGWAIVELFGWLGLLAAIVAWVALLVWRNRKSNRTDP